MPFHLRLTRLVPLLALTALAPGRAAAETVTLTPVRDATLFEDSQGAIANGGGQHLFAGRTNQPANRRALLAFDLAGQVPDGAMITAVNLRLNMSRSVSGGHTVRLHRLLAAWGEGTADAGGQEGSGTTADPGGATWIHTFHDTATWSSPGGDFAADASASLTVAGTGAYTWGSSGMVDDVRAWLDGSVANHGWILVGDESTNRSAKRFDSREHGTAGNRPQLTIEFDAPNAAPTVAAGLSDRALTAGESVDLDLGPAFSDPDGDALTYTAASDADAVDASITGSTLTLAAQAAGTATIAVTATDPEGSSAQTSLTVSVEAANAAPAVAAGLSDRALTAGESVDLDLGPAFSDPDGDALTYTAASDAEAVDASVAGSTLTLTAQAEGTATVSVTATDPDGAEAQATLTVMVRATVVVELAGAIPESFAVDPAAPNPFNPSTTIGYRLPVPARVSVRVHAVSGQHVATLVDGLQPAGRYAAIWDGRDAAGRPVATGVYLYVVRAGGFEQARRMTLLR